MKAEVTTPDGRTLRVEQDMIQVNYLSDIDGEWRFTDAAGHRHRCEYDAADHWPTLVQVPHEAWWCADCEDEHEDIHWECRECGEHIVPGMTGPGTKMVPGVITYTIDDQPVTREQAEAFTRQLHERGSAPGE